MTKVLQKDKVRSIRLSERRWKDLKSIKNKGESWDLLFKEIINQHNNKTLTKNL